MNKRIDYSLIIDDIKKSTGTEYILDQAKAEKIVKDQLPKSLFDSSYIKRGKNDLARFLNENDYKVTVIKPCLIISKNH